MKFKYTRLKGSSRPALRIQLRLKGGSQLFATLALVDSGAAFCVFPEDVADAIGIKDVRKGRYREAVGASGAKMDCYFHSVEMQVGGGWYAFEVAFSPQFGENALLGREGFFETFRVSFDERQERFELNPYTKKK